MCVCCNSFNSDCLTAHSKDTDIMGVCRSALHLTAATLPSNMKETFLISHDPDFTDDIIIYSATRHIITGRQKTVPHSLVDCSLLLHLSDMARRNRSRPIQRRNLTIIQLKTPKNSKKGLFPSFSAHLFLTLATSSQFPQAYSNKGGPQLNPNMKLRYQIFSSQFDFINICFHLQTGVCLFV